MLQKSVFKVAEKEKASWMFLSNSNFLKMGASSNHFLKTFIKYQLKTTVIEDRLDQNSYRYRLV